MLEVGRYSLLMAAVLVMAALSVRPCAAEPVLTKDGKGVQSGLAVYRPIDDSAVFFYQSPGAIGCPMPDPRVDLKAAIEHNGWHGMVRCRLTDYVDCSGTSHGFKESGGSRVLRIGDSVYRITLPTGRLGWFSYELATDPKPGKPHLVVCQLINDRERYTTVTCNQAEGTTWAAPYQGEEKYVPKNQEGDTWRCDVGSAVYTGREYYCDGKPFTFSMLFYPKTERAKITVSHRANEATYSELNGAAVARIWMFDILDPLPDAMADAPGAPGVSGIHSRNQASPGVSGIHSRNQASPGVSGIHSRNGATPGVSGIHSRNEASLSVSGTSSRNTGARHERTVALYIPHPWFLYSHFGIPAHTPEQRVKSMEETVRYLKFCGFDQLQLHIIDGSDRAGMAWYDSKLYKQLEGDIFKELLPIAEREGIEIVPIVAPIQPRWNKSYAEAPTTPDEMGWTRDSCCLDRDGKDFTRAFGSPAPNPLRPEVQEWQMKCLREVLDRCAKSPAVPAVGFRVNGKIGLCFSGEGHDKCGQDAGYNPWMIKEFSKDTGIEVPDMKPTPYQWIKDNCWDKWLEWRCERMHDFWLKCRDLVRSYRPDLKFIAACDLPSEWPGYNIEWPSGNYTIRDLFRHHGYDPQLFTSDDGIWIQRGMMVGSDRYWYDSWFPPKANAWAHKMFNYAPGVAESYKTKEPSSVELYHNYWEEDPHPDNEYGPTMRTATPVAYKDFFYEPAVFSLRKVNVDRVVFMGWERAVAGHEHDLRRFARAFRAIPRGEPKDFDGQTEVLSEGPQVPQDRMPEGYKKPEPDVLWVKWYGDRLVIVNDAFCSREVRVSLRQPLKKGESIFEHGAERIVYTAAGPGPAEFKLSLHPFDLQVLSIMPRASTPAVESARSATGVSLAVSSVGGVTAGARGTFDLILTNGSASTIKGVVLNVRLPRGWQEIGGDVRTLDTLPAGETHTFHVKASIPSEAAGVVDEVVATAAYVSGAERAQAEARVPAQAVAPVEVSQRSPAYPGAAGEVVTAQVTLTNNTAEAVAGRLTLDLPSGWSYRQLAEVTVRPGRVTEIPLDIAVPETATPRRMDATAVFEANGVRATPAPVAVDVVLRCPRATSKPAIDGRLSEWPAEAIIIDTPHFRLGEGADASTMRALAPVAWLSWDDQALYIAIRTSDSDYQNTFSGGEMWKGDSVQFGIDVHRTTSKGATGRSDTPVGLLSAKGYFEYGLSKGADGAPRLWRFKAPVGMKEGQVSAEGTAVAVDRDGTIYEAAIPWTELGFSPHPGDVIGVALVVNQFDNGTRRCVVFADGLVGEKDPTKFVGLRLER